MKNISKIILLISLIGFVSCGSSEQNSDELFEKAIAYYNDGDYSNAVVYTKKAAAKGDVGALCDLGYYYYRGEGVEQSYEKAIALFREAAAKGNVVALFWLGKCYYRGEGVEQSYEKAIDLFKKCAFKGFIQAQFDLGLHYAREGADQNINEAIMWVRRAEVNGHPDASEMLSNLASLKYQRE